MNKKGYQIIDFSGSSGGAVCALFAWYGLLQNDEKKSIELLDSFWEEIKANTPWDAGINYYMTTLTRLRSSGFPIPEISPYHNPPIECFVHDLDPDECKTDEIWIIQINPQSRFEEPKTIEDILDRRNVFYPFPMTIAIDIYNLK